MIFKKNVWYKIVKSSSGSIWYVKNAVESNLDRFKE